jgi:hypothetical protein
MHSRGAHKVAAGARGIDQLVLYDLVLYDRLSIVTFELKGGGGGIQDPVVLGCGLWGCALL